MSNVIEWRTAGKDAIYPFNDDSTLISNQGWTIPSDLFCDAQICSGKYQSLWISSAITGDSGISIEFTISSQDGVFGKFIAKLGQNKSTITGNYGEYRGTVILSYESQIPVVIGKQTFTETSAVFESSVVYQLPLQYVESISVNSTKIYNRMYLVEGSGIKIVKIDDSNLRIDAIGEPADPLPACYPQGNPLKSFGVNVIRQQGQSPFAVYSVLPTQYGNISILPKPLGAPTSDSSPRQILEITPDSPAKINFSLSR
jgi:hypothetical protein